MPFGKQQANPVESDFYNTLNALAQQRQQVQQQPVAPLAAMAVGPQDNADMAWAVLQHIQQLMSQARDRAGTRSESAL